MRRYKTRSCDHGLISSVLLTASLQLFFAPTSLIIVVGHASLSGNSGEGPQFEVTGQHVIIFVALVFAAAWAAGLLPDP